MFRATQIVAGRYLPGTVKRWGKFVRRRVRERKADRRFLRRSLPEIEVGEDSPDHILFVVVDALRADAIDGETTPFLDSLTGAEAVAPATWTYPSVCSLLSGLYPHEHGAMRKTDQPDLASESEVMLPPKLGDSVTTLPELFAGAGYETYGAFAFEMPMQALAGRFETHSLYTKGSAEELLDNYLEWMSSRTASQTFAYLHLFDPHGPFDTTPPQRYRSEHGVDADVVGGDAWQFTGNSQGKEAEQYRTHRIRLYNAAVDYVDDTLASATKSLSEMVEDSTLVVTGDHGEAFWENSSLDEKHFFDSRTAYGVGHGGTPYEALARVPLLADGLPVADGPASGIDIAPTIAAAAGIEASVPFTGQDHAKGLPENRIPLIEAARYGYEKKAVYQNGWKLLVSQGDDKALGFELPAEIQVELPRDVEQRLRSALPAWPSDTEASMGGESDREVDQSVQQRLSDLGYN
jgi:arylsulfatase A-like enzyme